MFPVRFEHLPFFGPFSANEGKPDVLAVVQFVGQINKVLSRRVFEQRPDITDAMAAMVTS